jgi:hypothetical protein
LHSSFQPSPSSSTFHDYHRPAIAADGSYAARDATDPAADSLVRVYDIIDNRLMFDDLVAKLALHAAGDIAAAAPAYARERLAHHALLG